MRGHAAVLLLCAFGFSLPVPLYGQVPENFVKNNPSVYSKSFTLSPLVFNIEDREIFKRWFNSRVAESESSKREKLREDWQEFLGIDVFYPYFKVKEVEKFVQDRTRFEFFNFRGKAEFEEGTSSVRYIFKKKF